MIEARGFELAERPRPLQIQVTNGRIARLYWSLAVCEETRRIYVHIAHEATAQERRVALFHARELARDGRLTPVLEGIAGWHQRKAHSARGWWVTKALGFYVDVDTEFERLVESLALPLSTNKVA